MSRVVFFEKSIPNIFRNKILQTEYFSLETYEHRRRVNQHFFSIKTNQHRSLAEFQFTCVSMFHYVSDSRWLLVG